MFERENGALLMAGGVIVAIHFATHPLGETSQFVQQAIWIPSHLLGYAGFMIVLLGSAGWYSSSSHKLGLTGLLGFLSFFLGTATIGGAVLWGGAIFQPLLVATNPSVNDSLSTSNTAMVALVLSAIPFLLGYLLFTSAIVRAKILPKGGTWLLAVSILSTALLLVTATFSTLLQNASGSILGLSIAGWGYALHLTKRES